MTGLRDIAVSGIGGGLDRAGKRIVLIGSLLPALDGVILFGVAGRLTWMAAWVYLMLRCTGLTLGMFWVSLRNPEVLNARGHRYPDTKPWDKRLLGLHMVLWLSVLAVSALDAGRLAVSSVPLAFRVLGALAMVVAAALSMWAMSVNPHFEPTVRIQKERGHRVISDGPYGIVRHPGYIGAVLIFLAIPLVLGSWWAFVPALLDVGVFWVRTAREDRTLRQELEGYAAYAERVRYRWVPHIW